MLSKGKTSQTESDTGHERSYAKATTQSNKIKKSSHPVLSVIIRFDICNKLFDFHKWLDRASTNFVKPWFKPSASAHPNLAKKHNSFL